MNKDLGLEIKDLADIKFAMDALGECLTTLKLNSTWYFLAGFNIIHNVFVSVFVAKIRERFVDDEALLTPIEECYAFLTRQGFKVAEEEINRADILRYSFNLLQNKTLSVQGKISSLQQEHRQKLVEAITKVSDDLWLS